MSPEANRTATLADIDVYAGWLHAISAHGALISERMDALLVSDEKETKPEERAVMSREARESIISHDAAFMMHVERVNHWLCMCNESMFATSEGERPCAELVEAFAAYGESFHDLVPKHEAMRAVSGPTGYLWETVAGAASNGMAGGNSFFDAAESSAMTGLFSWLGRKSIGSDSST